MNTINIFSPCSLLAPIPVEVFFWNFRKQADELEINFSHFWLDQALVESFENKISCQFFAVYYQRFNVSKNIQQIFFRNFIQRQWNQSLLSFEISLFKFHFLRINSKAFLWYLFDIIPHFSNRNRNPIAHGNNNFFLLGILLSSTGEFLPYSDIFLFFFRVEILITSFLFSALW